MSGRGFSYFAQTPGLPLSLKCMFNGRALYKFGRSEVTVDDLGYLILNDQQPYSIEIASPTRVETFVLWFPQNWAEEVLRSFDKPPETLLANPSNESGASAAILRTIHAARPRCLAQGPRFAQRPLKGRNRRWLAGRKIERVARGDADQPADPET